MQGLWYEELETHIETWMMHIFQKFNFEINYLFYESTTNS
jgi:hypothetical protein